tara:strand:+ start:5276 stop:6016 length:741 start_codon:yes stop_codon:yes gene_type:complete
VILLVDIGNTRIKWRCLNSKHEKICGGGFLSKLATLEFLKDLLQVYSIKSMYLSNVGQETVLTIFKEYSEKNEIKLNLVESQKSMCGLMFAYQEIERLGVDRCLAMIGAYDKRSVMVVDAGSAITVDYVNVKGEHVGGYILPGYEMSRSALLGKTAKVGVMASLGSDEPGTNTESCVNNGFAMLYKSFLDGCMVFAKKIDVNRFVLTGGDAQKFAPLSSEYIECYENLVLDGLQKYSIYYEQIPGV